MRTMDFARPNQKLTGCAILALLGRGFSAACACISVFAIGLLVPGSLSQVCAAQLRAAEETPPHPTTAQSTPQDASRPVAKYTGSESCKPCHVAAYEGWKKSRMANILLDPRAHPEAVVGDFAHPDPLRTFTLDDVAFTYGGRFKQRYFTRRGDNLYPLPAQWDVQKRRWLPYHVEAGTDWWVPFYGPANFDRPTGPTCDGCHSVNYDIKTHAVTEWNVGCEKCHGPGSLMWLTPLATTS